MPDEQLSDPSRQIEPDPPNLLAEAVPSAWQSVLQARLRRVHARRAESNLDWDQCIREAYLAFVDILTEAGESLSEALIAVSIPGWTFETAVFFGWNEPEGFVVSPLDYRHPKPLPLPTESLGRYRVRDDFKRYFMAKLEGRMEAARANMVEQEHVGRRPTDSGNAGDCKRWRHLDVEAIRRWIEDEGYTNQTLADKLKITPRTISSIRNNSRFHGADAVTKLANLMGRDPAGLSLG
jgi:hypothetical protein